jgi:murein DD-endopeptidase MepM/ murein hydrolase activator NlpD
LRERLHRRPLAALLATGALALAAVPLHGAFADNLHHKKHLADKHVHKAQADLDESSKQVREATDALLQSERDLSTARAALARTQAELSAAEALDRQMQAKLEQAQIRLTNAREALASGRADSAAETALLKRLVIDSYQQGSPEMLGLSTVLTTQDPTQLTGQLNSVQTVMDKQTATLSRVHATQVLLTVRQREVNAAEIEVAKERKAAADNLVRKQALEAQAADAEHQVAQMVDLRAQARKAAMQAKAKDLKDLRAEQAERDRIQRLIEQQASHTSGAYQGPGGGNGFLNMPVQGPITSPFGWRIHPIYGYRSLHDGIDIGAACGVPIHAPAAGKVISEYYQTAWGNRLIMDHGVHYGVGVSTIVNHLSGYAVTAGERVHRGEVIGYVGTTGWSTGCHTHFTVMENGVAVDPMKWL